VTQIYLKTDVLKTVEELRQMLGSKGTPIGNGIWRIEWSRDR